MSWVRFQLGAALPAAWVSLFTAIAGPKVTDKEIRAHLNCAWLVKNGLDSVQWPYKLQGPVGVPEPVPFDAVRAIPELREGVADLIQQVHYQARGVCRIAAWQRGGHLWWAPGSGKTLAALAWALLDPLKRPIALVTRGGARLQMLQEIQKYTTLRPAMLEGEGGERSWKAGEDPRIVVVGWETLPYHIENLRQLGVGSFIADESHRAKNPKRWNATTNEDGSMAFEKKNNLTGAAHELSRIAARVLCTTATPIANVRADLWAQLDLVDPHAWSNFRTWGFRYCNPTKSKYGSEKAYDFKGETNTAEFNARIYSWSAVDRVDYAETHRDLPPKRRLVTYVSRAEQNQHIAYAKLLKDAEREEKLGKSSDRLAEAKLMMAASRKRKAVVDLAGTYLFPQGKLLLFTGRVEDAQLLYGALQAKYPKVKGWLATGEDASQAERNEIQIEYMGDGAGRAAHPGPCYIVCTIDAMGESLNLQDTDVCIVVMLPWTPKALEQMEGRAHRRGTKRPVLYHYLIAEGTYDEHVADSLLAKLPMVENVMGETGLHGLVTELEGVENEDELVKGLALKIMRGPDIETEEIL